MTSCCAMFAHLQLSCCCCSGKLGPHTSRYHMQPHMQVRVSAGLWVAQQQPCECTYRLTIYAGYYGCATPSCTGRSTQQTATLTTCVLHVLLLFLVHRCCGGVAAGCGGCHQAEPAQPGPGVAGSVCQHSAVYLDPQLARPAGAQLLPGEPPCRRHTLALLLWFCHSGHTVLQLEQ